MRHPAEGSPELAKRYRLGNVILVASDVDLKTFAREHVPPSLDLAQQLIVYASRRDRALGFRMGKTRHAVELLSDERFVDLAANLRHFRDKYSAILARCQQRGNGLASVRETPYRRGERLHCAYIEAQRDEVVALLERVATAELALSSAGAGSARR